MRAGPLVSEIWRLPETDRMPFGCFEAIRFEAGLSVGASRWLGRRTYRLKALNLFGLELLSASWSAGTMILILSLNSEILRCFKCLSCHLPGNHSVRRFANAPSWFISFMNITLTFSEFALAMFHSCVIVDQGTYWGGTPPGATCRRHCNLLLKAAILPSRSSTGAEGALSPWNLYLDWWC